MKTGPAALIACAWAACASAQTHAPVDAPPPPAAGSAAVPSAIQLPAVAPVASVLPASTNSTDCCRVVTDTPVIVEIAEPINSSRQHRGDYFALRLAEPVTLDGNVVLPAGTTGVGQIVDASAAGSGGAPGKLVLAARHLDFAGQQLQLHALKLGATGANHAAVALGVSFAAGPFAMFVHGGQIEIPAGTRANARLAPNIGSPPTPAPPPPSSAIPQQEH